MPVKVNERQWQTKVKYNGFKFILVECPVKNFDAVSLGHRQFGTGIKINKVSK